MDILCGQLTINIITCGFSGITWLQTGEARYKIWCNL